MTKKSRTHPPLLFLAGAVLAAALACGGDEGNPISPTAPTPTNRAPQASQAIPDQAVLASGDKQLDLQGYFIDPDGDPLTFSAISDDTRVVTAAVAGSVLTINAVGPGTADVTVTAADPDGLTAAQSFAVTTEPPPNRPPRAAAPIPDRTLRLNQTDTDTVDLGPHFTDPDGDTLTFTATSANTRVVTAAVAGSTLTINAVGPGTADVTVTAADPDGLTAAQTFAVTTEPQPNRAPRAAAPIPDRTLRLNQTDTDTVDLRPHFTDPDGDPLTFTAISSDTRVVTAAVAGSTLTVTAVSPGTADVTVTAADLAGLTAAQTFAVTAEPRPNRAPRASAPIPDRTLRLNQTDTDTVDLRPHFTDPDGDPLTFTVISSDTRVVTAAVAGSILTINAVGAGTADVTVTAADPAGLTAGQSFAVTTEPQANRAPLVSAPILGRTLKLNESEKATVDLSLHFTDPDGDPLTFEATSSATQIATASVSNGTLTLLAGALGTANVTVGASDPGGLSATQAFAVTVELGRLSAELEVTTCQADGIGLANVVVEGSVRAVTPLSSARVIAYLDAQELGEQALGDMAAGETRGFAIRGSATVTASSRCQVELSAGGGNVAAAASVSFR